MDIAAAPKIDRSELVRLTQNLVRFATVNPPGHEALAAPFLKDYMEQMGLEVELQEVLPGRHNVIGRWRGGVGRPILLINGHYDVVPPGNGWTVDPFGGELRDGRLYGRGSFDMKGGIAAVLVAVQALLAAGVNPARDVLLTWVCDEEFHQRGTYAVVGAGLQADEALVAEGTGFQVLVCGKGALLFEVNLEGVAAHSSQPEKGQSAILAGAALLLAIHQYIATVQHRQYPLLTPPTINVGLIQGGHSEWAVAGHCRLVMDRRYLPSEQPDEVEAEVRAVVLRVAGEYPGVRFDLRRIAHSLSEPANQGSRVAQEIQRAAEQVLDHPPRVAGLLGAGDSAILTAAGIPTVNFGPAGDGAHGADEYVEVDSLEACAQTYLLAIARLIQEEKGDG